MTWWTDYQSRRGIDRKTLYLNNSKNIISTDFKHSTSYELVKINGIDRDVRIVEESSLIKDPNRKRLLCYPDETIDIGDIVEWENNKWLCMSNDDTSNVKGVGILEKCNNVLDIYKNGVLSQIPCIISTTISVNTTLAVDKNQYIQALDNELFITIPINTETNLINVNDKFKIGRFSYVAKSLSDVIKTNLYVMKMGFVADDVILPNYSISILNGDNLQIAQTQSLTLNVGVYADGELLTSPLPHSFISSDETIATVNNNVITFLSVGNVNITVKLDSDNTIQDIISIEVIANPIDNKTVQIFGSTNIIKGYTENFSCTFKNNGSEIVESSTFFIKADDGISATNLAEIVLQDNINNIVVIKGLNLGYVKLFVKNNDNSIVSDAYRIKIENLF